MEMLTPPHLDDRPEAATLGVTVVTPFRGMLKVRDQLLTELVDWLDQRHVDTQGNFFLRLRTVDMNGPMELEVGVTEPTHPGDDRVRAGSLPAGSTPRSGSSCASLPRRLDARLDLPAIDAGCLDLPDKLIQPRASNRGRPSPRLDA
jgi:hypothetical protein